MQSTSSPTTEPTSTGLFSGLLVGICPYQKTWHQVIDIDMYVVKMK